MLQIPRKLEPSPNLHRASVNSFGYGGVNAHAILECAPALMANICHDCHTLEGNTCADSGESLSTGCSRIPYDEAHQRVYDSVPGLCHLPQHDCGQCSFEETPMDDSRSVSNIGKSLGQTLKSMTKRLFVITGKTQEHVLSTAGRLRSWISASSGTNINLDNLAYTLASRRSMYQWRYAFQASSREDFVLHLNERLVPTRSSKSLKVLFIFTGQGAQWHAMGRELTLKYLVYRDSLLRSDAILQELGTPWALVHELGRCEKESRIHQSEIAQSSSTALQIALVDLLASFGVKPATVIGHSSGEIAAAYAAGAISHRTALKISFGRSLLSTVCKQKVSSKGAMLSVGLGEIQVAPLLLETRGGDVSLACVNSSLSTTVSGDESAILDLQSRLNDLGVFNRRLRVDTAYHSHHMRRVAHHYLCSLGTIETKAINDQVTFISTVTGTQKNEGFSSDYWVENLVSKVRFSDALEEYCKIETANSHSTSVEHLSIELGPHGTLAGPIQQTMEEMKQSLVHVYSPVLTRGHDAVQSILSLSGRLFEHGYHVDVPSVNCLLKSNNRLRVLPNLPTSSWDHSASYWHESRLSRDYRMRQHPYHDLLGIKVTSSPSLEPSWRYILDLDSLPWLADHMIDGLVTFPGAGYICMAIEAAKQLAEDKRFPAKSFVLQSISFLKALVIPPTPTSIELQICFRPQQLGRTTWDEFRVYAISEDDVWHEHCRGRICAKSASGPSPGDPPSSKPELHGNHLKGSQRLSANDVYSRLQANGNQYGPCFARIEGLQIADLQAMGHVTIPNIQPTMPAGYQQPHIIHPTTLDALLHTIVPLYEDRCGSGPVMPTFIEELSVFIDISNTPGESLFATVELYPNGGRSAFADLSVLGDKDLAKEQPLLMVSRMQLLGVGEPEHSGFVAPKIRNMAYQLHWIPEMASEIQKTSDTDLHLGIGATYRYDRSLLNISRGTNPSSHEVRKTIDKNGQPGHQIKLITADGCTEFATVLASLLHEDNHIVSSTTWASRAASTQEFYIILDDREKPFLESPSTVFFQQITEMINSVSSILWVSAQIGTADSGSSRDPKSALISGFARVARAEREQLRFTTLDIPDDISKDLPAASSATAEVVRRYLDSTDEMEYIYQGRQLLIPRLVPDRQINQSLAQAGGPVLEEMLYLRSKDPLKLDIDSLKHPNGLCFVQIPTTAELPKLDEVEVDAMAHCVDLRQIDQIKGRATESLLLCHGFAGIVRAIGSKTQTVIKIGDTVTGWNRHSSAYVNRPRTQICNITRVPSHWSLAVAAAMTIPLMSVYYSLVETAKLQESQSILIHGIAGLYGQVAIAMAKSTGAKVFATVSTCAQKEEFGMRFDLPPSCFLCDSDMSLKREVLRLTARKGLDVVLALPSDGPAPDLGGCMAALGVYVQLWRTKEDSDVAPPILARQAITFVSFDVDAIALHRPEKLADGLQKAISMLPDDFAPIANLECAAVSQVQDILAGSADLKPPKLVVLTADAETKVRVRRRIHADSWSQEYNLRSDATYVIAGGLGDLGQKISILMAKNGAKHLVLLSRRSPTQAKIDSLQENLRQFSPGLRLYAIACDISERVAVLDLPAKLENLTLPAVRGVLQSATVLHDRTLERMTAEDWQIPLRTKVYGTRNLDEAFKSSSLDFFVMLSSLSGVVGTRGQASYAAGNTYQDAFAHCRTDSQTAYIALDLGMIEQSPAYENLAGQVRAQNLLRQGWIPIKSEHLTAVLEWILSPGTWQRGSGQFAVGIDGASILEAENATPTTKSAMFTQVRGAYEIKAPIEYASSLEQKRSIATAATIEEARNIISEAVGQKVLSLVSVGKEGVDQDKPLQDFGLDSLTAIEVKNFIRKEFDATVHASEILDEHCLAALSSKIASRSQVLQKRFDDSSKTSNTEGGSASQPASPQELANGTELSSEEGSLPTLPLPSVEDTMDLYMISARPFLDANEFERTSEAVQLFKEKSGKRLQERLESINQTREIDNWQHDLQVSGVYLRRRLPIYPFGIFYGGHLLTERAHGQAERAAIIAQTAYAFKRTLEANELEPDYLNDERLCPQSLSWLFNACREPHKNVDRIRKHDRNEYLIVLRRGHAFKIALEQESHPVALAKLRVAFDDILDLSSQILPSIATLTADERDSWAEIRGVVMSSNLTNQNTVDAIEAAAFVLCLDDSSPATPTERCNSLLLGDPSNRWSDKTLQFVVCANGVSGYVCEHSMLDAASLRQINEYITTAIAQAAAEPEDNGTVHGHSEILEELKFHTNKVLVDNINRVRNHATTIYKPVEFAHFELPSMGSAFLRNHRTPSKSGIQVVIQLASLLYYGVQHPSWETLTMMLFRRGRLDWMQSVSPAMYRFCETAFEDDLTFVQRCRMLREAAGVHASTMARISRGQGFAAHLEALRELAQQEEEEEGGGGEGETLPELFNGPTWEKMRVLSPKKIKTDASEGLNAQEAGFFMPDPESVFVHYEMDEVGCRFFIQSTEGQTDRFCKALDQAAAQVRRLLEE